MKQYQIVLGLAAVLCAVQSKPASAMSALDAEAQAAFHAHDTKFFTITDVTVEEVADTAAADISSLRSDDPCVGSGRRPPVVDPEAPRSRRCTDSRSNSGAGRRDPRGDDGDLGDNPGPRDSRDIGTGRSTANRGRSSNSSRDSRTSSRGRSSRDDRDARDDRDSRDDGSADRDTRDSDRDEDNTYDRNRAGNNSGSRDRDDDSYYNDDRDWIGGGSGRGDDPTNPGLIVLDEIINMAQKIWKIVEDNRPVVSTKMDFADALPKGVKNWNDLEGWARIPGRKMYRASYKNAYGATVVDFLYRVVYTYGGNVDGKGKYLTHVTFETANLTVGWGFKFNAVGKVPNVVNVGTKASPVAMAEVFLDWKVESILKYQESSVHFNVYGDGTFADISN